MKPATALLLVALWLGCGPSLGVADTRAIVNAEAQINVAIYKLNGSTQSSASAAVATKALSSRYGLDAALITNMHQRKLGFGQISILLAISSKLPGGITGANIARLEAMRESRTVRGWGSLAQELNLNVGEIVSEVRDVQRGIRDRVLALNEQGKPDRAESGERAERAAERAEGRIESTRVRIERKEVHLRHVPRP